MARTSVKTRLVRKLAKRKEEKSLENYTASIRESLDTYDYDSAKSLCQETLKHYPNSEEALEYLAIIYLENEKNEVKAKECLQKSIEIHPNSGHSKYLMMAGISSGHEALEFYKKGLLLMEESSNSTIQKNEISSVYCAISELFMTDLCDEERAEENCVEAFEKAIAVDTCNPEAFQTKARYLLIREKFDESKEAIKTSLELWLPKYQAILDNKIQSNSSFDPVEICSLSLKTRAETVKILIELDDLDTASEICEGMLEEDDSLADIWYLLGWINRLRALGGEEEYNGNARFYLLKALEVDAINPIEDESIKEHIQEILNEIGSVEIEEEEENSQDDPEKWETLESSDEDENENNMDVN